MERKEKFIKGITLVCRDFVIGVEREMLQEAKNLSNSDWFVDMVCSYVDRYEEEFKSDMQEVFRIISSEKSDMVHFDAHTHSKSYRQVIIDILQGKAK